MSGTIWFRPYTLEDVRFFRASMPLHLGIEFTELLYGDRKSVV